MNKRLMVLVLGAALLGGCAMKEQAIQWNLCASALVTWAW